MKALALAPLAGGLLVGTLLAGCAAAPPRQADVTSPIPVDSSVGEYSLAGPDDMRPGAVRVIVLQIGPDMAQQCGIQRTHFEFDSAEPLPQDHLELKGIAACLNRPEIANLAVELVGRADARGRKAYNLDLGMRRANRVKEILVGQGVAPSRLTAISRGAADAQATGDGFFEEGFDRRVDINLVGVTHAPR